MYLSIALDMSISRDMLVKVDYYFRSILSVDLPIFVDKIFVVDFLLVYIYTFIINII